MSIYSEVKAMMDKNIKIRSSKRFDLQRKVVSHMTSSSWQNVPHVSYIYEPDITAFYDEFTKLSKERSKIGFKISFNTIMIKVIIEGLLKAPDLNSYIEYNNKKTDGVLHILEQINISIPWLLANGKMITPAIISAEKMSLNDIATYISDLSKRIEQTDIDEMLYKVAFTDTINELKKFNFKVFRRILASKVTKYKISRLKGKEKQAYYSIPESERLTEKDIMYGTITVSNIGSLYKDQKGFFALLEIIPPQVFAIGIGSIQEKPGVFLSPTRHKEIGIRKTLPMCLAFDHRAIDFNSIVPFLKALDSIFANPKVIYTW